MLTQHELIEELRASLEARGEKTPGIVIKDVDDNEYEFFDVSNVDGKILIEIERK